MLRADDTFPVAAAAEQRLDRRRFLRAVGSAAVVAACGDLLGSRRLDEERAETLTVSSAAVADLVVGAARSVADPSGRAALVVRLDDSSTVAFDRRCPHLGCPVLWSAERQRFECPCHHAAFDARTGRVLFGPPRHGLSPAHLRVA